MHEVDDDKKRRRMSGRLEPCWICKVYVLCLVSFAAYRALVAVDPHLFDRVYLVGSSGSEEIVDNATAVAHSWLPDIYAAIPAKEDLLVHQPFFWGQLLALADVKLGNWAKASKGFAKVDDRSSLWRGVAAWQEEARASPQGQTRATVVFAKCSLCTLLSADRSYVPGPYVVLGTFNDNWGMLADNRANIHHKQSLQMMLDKRCGRTMADLEAFLGDPRLKLWFVNHHVFRRLGLRTEKVLSLPLGVQDRAVWSVGFGLWAEQQKQQQWGRQQHPQQQQQQQARAEEFADTRAAASREREGKGHPGGGSGGGKVRLLEVNNNEWRFRAALNEAVNSSFGSTLVNSYNTDYKAKNATLPASQRRQVQAAYLQRLSESDFVLCPPGLGMDSYRVYEVLAMGSVPVVERSPGLDRALAHLPVLFVENLASDLTPTLLHHVLGALMMRPPVLRNTVRGGKTSETQPSGGALRENNAGGNRHGAAAASLGRAPPQAFQAAWEFERLTGAFWVERVREAAATGVVPDDWSEVAEEESEGGRCRCWFPAGRCVDLEVCRTSNKSKGV